MLMCPLFDRPQSDLSPSRARDLEPQSALGNVNALYREKPVLAGTDRTAARRWRFLAPSARKGLGLPLKLLVRLHLEVFQVVTHFVWTFLASRGNEGVELDANTQ